MPDRPPAGRSKKERLDEALEMTFPASDPVAVTYEDDGGADHRGPAERPAKQPASRPSRAPGRRRPR